MINPSLLIIQIVIPGNGLSERQLNFACVAAPDQEVCSFCIHSDFDRKRH